MALIKKDTPEGFEFAGRVRKLTQERLNFFSGGFPKGPNWPAKNIHTDLEAAKKAGLKTVAASGAMFEGYLADLMIEIFGGNWLKKGKLSLAFTGIVNKNDSLIPRAVVKAKATVGSKIECTMEVWCENQRGEKVVVGTAKGIIE